MSYGEGFFQASYLVNEEPAFLPNRTSTRTPDSATGGPPGVMEAPAGAGGPGAGLGPVATSSPVVWYRPLGPLHTPI